MNSITRTFTLRGKKYSLSRDDIKQVAQLETPEQVEKYAVEVEGKFFPPKQLLRLALDIPGSNFTTMDATRILQRLDFAPITPDPEDAPNGSFAEIEDPMQEMMFLLGTMRSLNPLAVDRMVELLQQYWKDEA